VWLKRVPNIHIAITINPSNISLLTINTTNVKPRAETFTVISIPAQYQVNHLTIAQKWLGQTITAYMGSQTMHNAILSISLGGPDIMQQCHVSSEDIPRSESCKLNSEGNEYMHAAYSIAPSVICKYQLLATHYKLPVCMLATQLQAVAILQTHIPAHAFKKEQSSLEQLCVQLPLKSVYSLLDCSGIAITNATQELFKIVVGTYYLGIQ